MWWLLVLVWGNACMGEEHTCTLSSTVPDYEPSCVAYLVLYPEEARLYVDEVLVAYLPADPQPDTTYGGSSGNALTLILDEELAKGRGSTVTFGPKLSEVRFDATFDTGEVNGLVFAELIEGDPVW